MKFSNIQIFSLAILFLVSCNEKKKKKKLSRELNPKRNLRVIP